MSGCLYCGKPTEMSKRGFLKKYCSDKCMHRWHSWQKTGKRPKDNVGEITRKRKEQRQKNIEQFEWYSENWLTVKQVAELTGLSESTVYRRSKTRGVEYKIVPMGTVSSHKAFWNPEDIDKLIPKETPIPEGYLNKKQAAEYLDMALNTFQQYNNSALPFLEWNFKRKLYKPEDLDAWNKERIEKRAQEAEERKKAKKLKREIEQEKQRLAEEEARKKATLGLINTSQAASRLGMGADYVRKHLVPIKKISNLHWFNAADVEALIWKRFLEKKSIALPDLVLREDDYTSVKAYEEKLFNVKIPKMLANSPTKGNLKAIALNEKYHNDRMGRGFIHSLECEECNKRLPYTAFHWSKHSTRGRNNKCKRCVSKIMKSKYSPGYAKQQRKDNYVQKIRTIVGTTIKKKISKYRRSYAKDISIPDIWDYIEKNLGYNASDLCAHLEAKFDAHMTWDNHGRGNGYHWHIDHIKPQMDFPYTSLDDINFKKCWDLSNLRPLEQKENIRQGIKLQHKK